MIKFGDEAHYADPYQTACASDEVNITVEGVEGAFCSPECGLLKKCPGDLPPGNSATPECALQDSGTGQKYCVLICAPSLPIMDQKAANDVCGDNASCKPIQTTGVCTYDK